MTDRQGNEVWVEVSAVPLQDQAGTAVQKLEFGMGMCMECHRKKKVSIDCWKCHY